MYKIINRNVCVILSACKFKNAEEMYLLVAKIQSNKSGDGTPTMAMFKFVQSHMSSLTYKELDK